MSKALAAWLFITAAAAAPAASPSVAPREVVQAAVSRVVMVLEDLRLNPPAAEPVGRVAMPDRTRTEIRRIANDLFDFEEIARRALGRYWAGRTKPEQTEFVSLFTDLLERAYIGKIESYSGEKILYTGEVVDGQYALVRSRIITRRRTETALDYRLHKPDGQWKVYDVLIDNVSFVSTYRSEFNRMLQSSTWQDLMDRLRKKRIEIRSVGSRSES
jgi:phospholipid transport system substrate-binding protein